MSCNLRRLLTTGPLFNRLSLNTAILLSEIGGNPLIGRKILKIILFLIKYSTVSIKNPVNKTLNQVYFKTHHCGNDNDTGGELFNKLVATCHECGKMIIFKGIVNPRENFLFGIYLILQQESF